MSDQYHFPLFNPPPPKKNPAPIKEKADWATKLEWTIRRKKNLLLGFESLILQSIA